MELPNFVQTVVVPLAASAIGIAFCWGVLCLRSQERELRTQGLTARATVLRKFRKDGEGWLENSYAAVSFRDGENRTHEVEVKVPSRAWRGLAEGGTTAISYLPQNPERVGFGPVWGRKLVGAFLLYIALCGAAMAVLGVGIPLADILRSTKPGDSFVGIVVMGLFAAGCVAVLLLSRRQSVHRRAAMVQFAANHKWAFLGRDSPQLLPLLEAFGQDESWSVNDVVRAQEPPGTLYLFHYQSHVRASRSSGSLGFACLAEASGRHDEVVTVFPRIPLVQALMTGKQEVGEPEFRQKYVVVCKSLQVAQASLTGSVQKVLLEHSVEPGWVLEVRIGRPGVLVMSPYAVGPAEWEYLVQVAQRIRPS